MPMLTREMIKQQQVARNAARLSTPSTPSSHSTSSAPSLSSSPASTSSSFSRSSTPSSRGHTRVDKCWIPTLDEVSRADPDECARLFARLAQEAEYDATPRTPERRAKTSHSMHSSAKPPGYSSVEIGAMALQLVRPCQEHPIEHPTLSAPMWDNLDDSVMEVDDQQLFSEWTVDVLESPVTSTFLMSESPVSDDVIAVWSREDEEMKTMERETQSNQLHKLGYHI
ncbi:hypothetical protein V565_227900 [Rhizoctonia solani 123E]|uniref:Uncharacterized protein n=1 Tax=Rhizoctonia solani 123E TaxID=1423351 RepID=A0A074RKS9_9AGAM|nr:hypothetical protein V565_227900 [Rhizoctonia solani 123E]